MNEHLGCVCGGGYVHDGDADNNHGDNDDNNVTSLAVALSAARHTGGSQDFFTIMHFCRLFLSKFWAQGPPGSKLRCSPLTKILDPPLVHFRVLFGVLHSYASTKGSTTCSLFTYIQLVRHRFEEDGCR